MKARSIGELQDQLKKLGGKGESTTTISAQPSESMYPSIRKLPLLGVAYADLYRGTKIQEAFLETLTKEYEMAKVQEAKEIPTVKVLDSANLPEKKSFPPRLLIIFLGMTLALAAATTWVFGKTAWDQTDSNDPRKVFAQEVFSTVAASAPFISQNGSGGHSVNGQFGVGYASAKLTALRPHLRMMQEIRSRRRFCCDWLTLEGLRHKCPCTHMPL